MKYDLENILDDVKTCMTTYLNTKIVAINTEKNDTITLKQVPAEGYFMQTLDERYSNFNPFVFFGISAGIEAEGIGPAVSKVIPIFITIINFDQNEADIARRYLRYNRALEEIFLENWDKISNNGTKIKVRSPVPIDFTLLNNSDPFRAIGTELEVTVA